MLHWRADPQQRPTIPFNLHIANTWMEPKTNSNLVRHLNSAFAQQGVYLHVDDPVTTGRKPNGDFVSGSVIYRELALTHMKICLPLAQTIMKRGTLMHGQILRPPAHHECFFTCDGLSGTPERSGCTQKHAIRSVRLDRKLTRLEQQRQRFTKGHFCASAASRGGPEEARQHAFTCNCPYCSYNEIVIRRNDLSTLARFSADCMLPAEVYLDINNVSQPFHNWASACKARRNVRNDAVQTINRV